MGNTISTSDKATHCVYNKTDFKTTISIIKDAHSVMQFYASFLLLPKLPSDVTMFKNYNDITEQVFNSRRKEEIPELTKINPAIKSYYNVLSMLDSIKGMYITSSDETKRSLIEQAFNLTYNVLVLLINELGNSCDAYGSEVIVKK